MEKEERRIDDFCKEPHWKTADSMTYRLLKDERKQNRDNMTPAETRLWEELKSNKLGVKFRRQHMIMEFIVDFVTFPSKLVIEVDGGIHIAQKEYDENRTFLLTEKGYTVIRFKNEDVIQNLNDVLTHIKQELKRLG